jgi:hypothetical protein
MGTIYALHVSCIRITCGESNNPAWIGGVEKQSLSYPLLVKR